MSEASIHPLGDPVQRVGDTIVVPTKVRSTDYGRGSIVADYGPIGVQIYWDIPVAGTTTHLMVHERSWVALLENLPPEMP